VTVDEVKGQEMTDKLELTRPVANNIKLYITGFGATETNVSWADKLKH
jgi:hypothetical protein